MYSKLDAYTKNKITKVLNKRNLFIIAFIIGWYLWYRYGDYTTVSDANRWMPLILLGVVAGSQFIESLRYQTQQFVSPNFHGCYSKPPKFVNGFYIFAIDSFNASGLSWDFAKRIVVVREETVELFTEGAVCIAHCSFVSKYELDDDVRYFIENNQFFKRATGQVFYGWWDDIEKIDYDFQKLKNLEENKNDPTHIYNLLKKELGVDNPKIHTLYWLYRNQCKATGKQTENYDATVESVEKQVEHTKRIKDAYTDKQDSRLYPSKQEGYEEY